MLEDDASYRTISHHTGRALFFLVTFFSAFIRVYVSEKVNKKASNHHPSSGSGKGGEGSKMGKERRLASEKTTKIISLLSSIRW